MLTKNFKFGGKIFESTRFIHKTMSKANVSTLQIVNPVDNAAVPLSYNKYTPKEVLHGKHDITQQEFMIEAYDPEIMELVNEEADRQRKSVDLIASSNVPFAGVNEITKVLGNKSSPGFPTGRFF